MSNPIDQHALKIKKERLKIQFEVLELIRFSHTSWMNSTNNSESKRLHQEIAEFVGKSADHCGILIANLGT